MNSALRSALLSEACRISPRRPVCAPYLEIELQAYVEQNISADLSAWFGLVAKQTSLPVRVLGAKVPCSVGQIDLLAQVGEQIVIVELKAQPVTERTVGQVLRYKLAVEAALTANLWRTSLDRGQIDAIRTAEVRALCMVIGPSFEPYAVATLGHLGWALVATRQEPGRFAIKPHETVAFPSDDRELKRLTNPFIADELGRCLAWHQQSD